MRAGKMVQKVMLKKEKEKKRGAVGKVEHEEIQVG